MYKTKTTAIYIVVERTQSEDTIVDFLGSCHDR